MKQAFLWALLASLTVSQYCSMCALPNCTYVAPGLSSCSSCSAGALLNVTVPVPDSPYNISIGLCQPCPIACSTCHFGMMPQFQQPSTFANMCDECETNYTYNYTSGGCILLPANCRNGTCNGGICSYVSCSQCENGYSLVRRPGQDGFLIWECYQTGTVALEGKEEDSSIVGVAIWAIITTLAAGVLVTLYMRERRKNRQPLILNPTSQKRVSF